VEKHDEQNNLQSDNYQSVGLVTPCILPIFSASSTNFEGSILDRSTASLEARIRPWIILLAFSASFFRKKDTSTLFSIKLLSITFNEAKNGVVKIYISAIFLIGILNDLPV
jgi:hypothetical protein